MRLLKTIIFTLLLFTINSISLKAQNNEQNYLAWLSTQKIPDSLSFCGEKVPTEIPEIKERAEREFYLLMQQPGQILLYFKRAGRFFPVFEKVLKEEDAPDDLKYLSVAESALFLARSPKDAVGLWQFMEATGRAYGLTINDYIDERKNTEKSTRAAVKYLKQGFASSKSWVLSAAGYNMGNAGVRAAQEYQNQENYFDLYLNDETSRYIFRIAIIKAIMQSPEKYGVDLKKLEVYQAEQTKSVTCEKAIPNLAEWAKKQGSNFKSVKLLNPWILKKELPAPKKEPYTILLPAD